MEDQYYKKLSLPWIHELDKATAETEALIKAIRQIEKLLTDADSPPWKVKGLKATGRQVCLSICKEALIKVGDEEEDDE